MQRLFTLLDRFVVLIGSLVVLAVLLHFGFNIDESIQMRIQFFVYSMSILFGVQEIFRFFKYKSKSDYFMFRWYEGSLLILKVLLFVKICFYPFESNSTQMDVSIGGFSLVIFMGVFSSLVVRLEDRVKASRFKLQPQQLFVLSFAIPVLIGMFLFKLPKATSSEIGWIDALFMSTSSISVTGLSVIHMDQLTILGKMILLILVQIGGLGIMTLSISFASFIAGGVSIKDRVMISSMFSEDRMSEVKKLLFKIIGYTFAIEFIGATYLFYTQQINLSHLSLVNQVFHSVFYSVTAFCNAGFSLYQNNLMDPFLSQNYFFILGLMILIVIGGIGFPTISNLKKYIIYKLKLDSKPVRLNLNSKIVLSMTLLLLISGTLVIYFLERRQSFTGLTNFQALVQSSFLSITSRTAGFNLWPTEDLSVLTLLIVIVLMWIGAAPMSTAGGVKVTTIFIALLNVKRQLQNSNHINVMGKEIASEIVVKSFAVISLSFIFIALSTGVMIYFEPNISALSLFFESVSAISTVGLSTGITTELSDLSKIVLIVLMFVGRVGIIAVLISMMKSKENLRYKFLKEDINI